MLIQKIKDHRQHDPPCTTYVLYTEREADKEFIAEIIDFGECRRAPDRQRQVDGMTGRMICESLANFLAEANDDKYVDSIKSDLDPLAIGWPSLLINAVVVRSFFY